MKSNGSQREVERSRKTERYDVFGAIGRLLWNDGGRNTWEGSAGTGCTALATIEATSHLVARRVAELISASITGDTEIDL